jgi:hypothetical protein
MYEERSAARGPTLGRWMIVAALLAVGIILYFWFAPASEPPAPAAAVSR